MRTNVFRKVWEFRHRLPTPDLLGPEDIHSIFLIRQDEGKVLIGFIVNHAGHFNGL